MTTDTATPISCHDHGNCELCDQIERDLRECAELLIASAEEMEESCRIEGRLTSMKVTAERIRSLLARLKGTPNLSALQERDDAQG